MIPHWRKRWRRFLTVWGLFGAIASGGVFTLMVAAKAFIKYAFDGAGGLTLDTPLLLLVALPIVWLVVGLLAVLPSVFVGVIHWMISRCIKSTNMIQLLTCAIAAIVALPYGMVAASISYDGIPLLWLPISMVLGAFACFATLRVQEAVYGEATQVSHTPSSAIAHTEPSRTDVPRTG